MGRGVVTRLERQKADVVTVTQRTRESNCPVIKRTALVKMCVGVCTGKVASEGRRFYSTVEGMGKITQATMENYICI